ncbi:hypothetical protein L195_g064597, partial [Trifolium pratense]
MKKLGVLYLQCSRGKHRDQMDFQLVFTKKLGKR